MIDFISSSSRIVMAEVGILFTSLSLNYHMDINFNMINF